MILLVYSLPRKHVHCVIHPDYTITCMAFVVKKAHKILYLDKTKTMAKVNLILKTKSSTCATPVAMDNYPQFCFVFFFSLIVLHAVLPPHPALLPVVH